jgi:hypothetical protein
LSDWKDKDIFLALDTSLFWDEYCLVRLCVVYRGRALPVVWRWLADKSLRAGLEKPCNERIDKTQGEQAS